ncbi:endonuclease VII domain-containing protein [Streptomyces sp. NPDC054787]
MIAAQGGTCLLCRTAPAEHVDHDHQTGKVRGVLCFSCNAALGQFKDRPDVIRRAAAYVEGNLWNPTLVAQGVYRQPS